MDDTLRLALETIEQGKQAIVFVASRASAEKTAEDISKLLQISEITQDISAKAGKVVSPATKQCKRLSLCLSKGIAFHHAGLANKQKEIIEDEFKAGNVKIICATPTLAAGLSLPVFRVILKSLKRFSGKWGMDWIPVLEYMQMAGRAGRPEYEKFGEAIAIAKDKGQRDEIYNRYILGEAEDIYSKLAVEPVLRTYLLSLIASGIIKDEREMKEFFKETFWATQFNDFEKLEEIMERMLDFLEEWEFAKCESVDGEYEKEGMDHVITEQKDGFTDFALANTLLNRMKKKKQRSQNPRKLKATLMGKRVSQLYLDPLTAQHLITCLKKGEAQETNSFSYIQMISNTLEMRPLLRIKSKEKVDMQNILMENYEHLLSDEPEVYDLDYHEFMNSIKTSVFFNEWINEKKEDYMFESLGVRPGEIRVKLETADWLLYASTELADLLSLNGSSRELRKLRVRVKNGIKAELLPLIKFKGIGRARARKLHNNGLKSLSDIKRTDLGTLNLILGPKLAGELKGEIGQNIPSEIPKGRRKGQLSLSKFS